MRDAHSRRYVLWNSEMTRRYGHARAEALGKTSRELFGPEIDDLFRASDDEAVRTGRMVEVIRRQKDAAGREIVVLARKVPLRDAARRITHILGITLDVTGREGQQAPSPPLGDSMRNRAK